MNIQEKSKVDQQGDGWTYELYANDEAPKTPGKMVLDICIPVKPL